MRRLIIIPAVAAALLAGCGSGGSDSSSSSSTTTHASHPPKLTAQIVANKFVTQPGGPELLVRICRDKTYLGRMLSLQAATTGVTKSPFALVLVRNGIAPSDVARAILDKC